MALGIVINDLVHFFKVDGAAFVDVDGEEARFVLVFVPCLRRVGRPHELFAEASALVHVQISVAIIVSLREDCVYHCLELFTSHFGFVALLLSGLFLCSIVDFGSLLTTHLYSLLAL